MSFILLGKARNIEYNKTHRNMLKPILTLNFWPILLLAFLLGLIIAGVASKSSQNEAQSDQKFSKKYTYSVRK